jgi:transposase
MSHSVIGPWPAPSRTWIRRLPSRFNKLRLPFPQAEALVIGWEKHVLLRHYLEQGLTKSAIAKRLGIDRRTITRWIQAGELDRDVDVAPRYLPRPPRPGKLEPYRPIIEARLAAYPKLSAVRLLAEIRAAGYEGGYSQVRDYVRTVRPRALEDPVVRFETPPAKQAQVDFAHFRLPWGKRYALLVVLGHSRHMWLRFFRRQDMRTVFLGLEDAFRFFGGVPHELLFDQMKAVITRDLRLDGGSLVHNAEFLRFASHWGFKARACRPYRAKTKGKVERPIRYVRENFFYGREFLNDGDLAEQSDRWLTGTANVRIHQTTKQVPVKHFQRDELSLLLPLAPRSYQSLMLPIERKLTPSAPPGLPRVDVERRPLSRYAAIAGGAL